jgi:hypothetical protein
MILNAWVMWPGITYRKRLRVGESVDWFPMEWMEFFRINFDWNWCPPDLLYSRYRVSLPGLKQLERGVEHPPPSNTKIKERVNNNIPPPGFHGLFWNEMCVAVLCMLQSHKEVKWIFYTQNSQLISLHVSAVLCHLQVILSFSYVLIFGFTHDMWLKLADDVSEMLTASFFKVNLITKNNSIIITFTLKMKPTKGSETSSLVNLSHTPWVNPKIKTYISEYVENLKKHSSFYLMSTTSAMFAGYRNETTVKKFNIFMFSTVLCLDKLF